MNILSILVTKRDLIRGDSPVDFSGDELNVLCNPAQLRALKLYEPFPEEYHTSATLDDCITKIKQGDCLYRTLEYCIIRNCALNSIKEVFPSIG